MAARPSAVRRRKNYVPYWDEQFTQYIIDAVSSVDESVIKQFTAEDQDLLRNVNSLSIEQRLYLCGKLGKRFAIVIADRGKVSNRPINVKAISTWFRKRIFGLIGMTLKNWGMFVRADKEIMQNLSRLSLDINPKTMYILRNHEEIAQHAENVRSLDVKIAIEHQSQLLIDRLLSEAYSFIGHYSIYDQKRYKTLKEQIPILFYLSYQRDRYISVPELAVHLGESSKSSRFQFLINQLVQSGHVQEDLQEGLIMPNRVERVYQLTGYGVITVNQIRERITTHS